MKKVTVAMSGGVDSSVSAALLKKAGFDVTGMFMKCWAEGTACTTNDDERMARLAAAKIGIPFYSVNLIAEYKERVVQYLLDGYKKGITPNPDVMCNKEIKFGLLFDKAMELGADYLATGHYARISSGTQNSRSRTGSTSILMAKDKNKDQSYFLSFVRPEVLEKVMFPVGNYTKPEVRKLAKKFGLPNAGRKDSQGICFVGKVDFVDFLKEYIPAKSGNIVNMQGNMLGRHQGAFSYTIGQRKGLGLSGGPYFVVDKDVKKNTITVSKNEADLLGNTARLQNTNWFGEPAKQKVSVKIRYRQTPASGTLEVDKGGGVRVRFTNPQRAITPGQLAVLYQGERLLAGGIIE